MTYNSGTQTVALSIGSGLTTSSGSLALAAHKASHSTGGSDALSPADIGAAAVSHTHTAQDIQSGVIAPARLAATGTPSNSTFLRGDNVWATVVQTVIDGGSASTVAGSIDGGSATTA